MKKILLITLAIIALALPVGANQDLYELTKAAFPVLINGVELKSDLPILVYDGNTYIPLRKVSEATGAKVEWDDINKKVKITVNNDSSSSEIITSNIDGSFFGYDKSKAYKLKNGQIWEQISSETSTASGLNTGVLVFKSGSDYKMRVDGQDHIITVKRTK